MSPRFSIVIPTRDRPHTLAFTLQTCRVQSFADVEFLVSDNYSQANIRDMVEQLGDPRFRYVRTDAPLAGTDSWEFAVEQARGEFVTILGDDDGLMQHSLIAMDRLLREAQARVLRWDCVLYCWPDLIPQKYHRPGSLLIPLRMAGGQHVLEHRQSLAVMHAVARGDLCYTQLPMIYCSMIHRDLLEEMRRRTGRVFEGQTQDVYSGFTMAYLAGSYHSVNAPLAISGLSGRSTGVARHCFKKSSSIMKEFRDFNARAGLALHPWIPDLPPISLAVADAFLHARQTLFPADETLSLDRRHMIANCLDQIRPDSPQEWDTAIQTCRATLANDADLLRWFDDTQANRPLPAPYQGPEYRRYGGDYLYVDTTNWNIVNLVEAADFCELLLGYRRDCVNVTICQKTVEEGPSLNELQKKEAVIQDLKVMAEERLEIIQRLSAQLEGAVSEGQALAHASRRSLPMRAVGFVRRLFRKGLARLLRKSA